MTAAGKAAAVEITGADTIVNPPRLTAGFPGHWRPKGLYTPAGVAGDHESSTVSPIAWENPL